MHPYSVAWPLSLLCFMLIISMGNMLYFTLNAITAYKIFNSFHLNMTLSHHENEPTLGIISKQLTAVTNKLVFESHSTLVMCHLLIDSVKSLQLSHADCTFRM